MPKSFLVMSAAVHLAILLLVGSFAAKRPPPIPAITYLELAGVSLTGPVPLQTSPARLQPTPMTESASAAKPEPAAEVAEETLEEPATPQVIATVNQQGQELSRAFAAAARQQAMVHNTRSYFTTTETAVKKLVEGKLLPGDMGRFEGQRVAVSATYGAGALVALTVSADDEEMGEVLDDETAWAKIPAPSNYLLTANKVTFLVSLDRGRISVGISPQ